MYKIFSPYRHLTESFVLSSEEIARVKAGLSKANLNSLEAGHAVQLGASAVWKVS